MAVELRFDAQVAQDVTHFIFHPDQTVTANPGGSLTVRFTAGGLDEVCWHLVTWGTQRHHRTARPPPPLHRRPMRHPRRPPRHLNGTRPKRRLTVAGDTTEIRRHPANFSPSTSDYGVPG